MKSELAKLEREFDNEIWRRGREYYREGLVGKVIKTGNVIKAESYGSSTYRLEINLKTKEMKCSCPCDFYCKHLAALVIWLKNNKIADFSEQMHLLESKTKAELVSALSDILKKQPDFSVYLQMLDNDAIVDLIKKLWIPKNNDLVSFFNKIDFIKESIFKKNKFNLIVLFLRKLIDMHNHDAEFDELVGYIDEFLDDVSKINLAKKQKDEIGEIIKGSVFE